jgi:hypothetical protein
MNKTSGHCMDAYCPMKAAFPAQLPATPSPRYLPVNIPFSLFGITIVTLDGYGNVIIKVDQPYPAPESPAVGKSEA